MASGARPFLRGKSFSKSKDQRVDIDIPLPRDDRPSWGRRPSNPSSLKTSVGTTTAADLVSQSRGDTSETPALHEPFAEEVRHDLSKPPDMEVFRVTTNDILSPTAGRVQDGNDRSFVETSPHADDNATAARFAPTSKHVGLHGKDKDPMPHQPCQQGDASPRPGSSMGGAQCRRASLPLPARPGSSASPRRKSFSVNDADSAATGPRISGSPKKKFSAVHDVELDTMNMASTGVRCLQRQAEAPRPSTDDVPVQRNPPLSARHFSTDPTPADDIPVQRTPTLSGGGRPPSQSAPSRPGFKKASTFSEITSVVADPSSPKGEGGGRARRLSLIPAGQLQRQLSFADESLDELSANIFAEEPQVDWLEDFWNRVLVGIPPAECRGLSTRSIDYWVEIFNRWQAMGSWKRGSAPKFMDAYELQELLSVPMPKTLAWVKLFDPAAYAQHASTRSAMDLKRVKVPVHAFLASGIFLSTTISKRQKVRFLLGMFDENDGRILNSAEFVEMISSFLHGIACAFALVDTVSLAPKPSLRRKLGKCLFDRVVNSACCSLPFWEAKKIKAKDAAPIWLIEEWFLSEGGDPLAAPFAMLLERFSVRELEDDPEFFEDEDKSFKLSHTAPVELPLQTAAALDSSFLRRDEIGLGRKVFRECERQCDFSLSHEDIGRALGEFIPPDLWCDRLVRGLDEMERLRGVGQTLALT
ncbi:unnamed protein product [Symbiodinium sp. CCMP2456]|nr:unnamed protein product [Symbiodinium sp. CCMP2456]